MEIQQFKGFLAIVKTGSFSKAAEKTFRTQPAITLQIKALEQELGTTLFERFNHKKMCLTTEGHIFYELIDPLMSEVDSITDHFKEACSKKPLGPVKIATHTSVMVHLLPKVIMQFRKSYKDAKLSIVHRSRQDIISMVKNGEADIGITSMKTTPEGFEYMPFASFRRLLIAPKNHALSKTKKIDAKTIAKYPLILPAIGSNTRAAIDSVFTNNNIQPQIAMEITGREASKLYVKMALGISIINEYFLDAADNKTLATRDVSYLFGKTERGLLTNKKRRLNQACCKFIKLLTDKKL